MSRFAVTTLATFAVAIATVELLHGDERWWLVWVVWAVYAVIFGLGVSLIQMQFFCPAICRAPKGRMRVALTFDDGPDEAATPMLLDLLRREGVSAAFFCIGKRVRAHPQLAARIAAEGHLLGNHTFRHVWWTVFLRRRGLIQEIARTQQAIQDATGVTPMYMRPPIGLTNPHYAGAMRKTGLTLVGWSVRSLERVFSASSVIARIRRKTRDGGIILLHDGGTSPEHLREIVSAAIRDLRSDGFDFERLDRLIEPASAPLAAEAGPSR